jgi:alpha-tubulin suppressor-like RCC1 family protein
MIEKYLISVSLCVTAAMNKCHVVLLNDTGKTLYSCGVNDFGQLGLGDCKRRDNFTLVDLPVEFSSISVGHKDFCIGIAEEDGSLWGWGDNSEGQLGLPKERKHLSEGIFSNLGVYEGGNKSMPTQIPQTRNFTQVATGHQFSLALDIDGRVWSFGLNAFGQLGLGDLKTRYSPTIILPLVDQCITSVSAGLQHGIVLDSNGKLWSFGHNDFGQLGLTDRVNRYSPQQVTWPRDVVQVSSGYYHNLILDSGSNVWAFGYNYYGQIGTGERSRHVETPLLNSSLENISRVICGGNTSFCIDVHHRVFVFGDNEDDKFEFNIQENILFPREKESWCNTTVLPGGHHTLIVDEDGNLFLYGYITGVPIQTGKQDITFAIKKCAMIKSGFSVV